MRNKVKKKKHKNFTKLVLFNMLYITLFMFGLMMALILLVAIF